MLSGHVFAAEGIVLRTSVMPEEAWIGQRVILHVDALGENGWAQIKKIGDFDVPGAYLMRTESQGTRLQETIDGISYSGQRYELSLYPQRSGIIEVPTFPVEVTVKSWGVGAKETVHRARTPGATFACKVPPGAEAIRGLISTTSLTASQKWEPETDNPKVGDAVKRTITLQASDVSGMAFAPMQHPAIERLGIYPGEPIVEDASARGSLTGTRIETVTYVFERPGKIAIPGVVLSWWDVAALELKRVELPGLDLQVVGTLAAETGAVTQAEHQQNKPLLWLTLVATAIAAFLAVRYRGSVAARLTAWRDARRKTEAVYFRRLLRSIRSRNPNATLRDTMQWLDRINHQHSPARLDLFLARFGNLQVQEEAARLTQSCASGRKEWEPAAFSRGLSAARKRWRKAQLQSDAVARALPELNPIGTGRVETSRKLAGESSLRDGRNP